MNKTGWWIGGVFAAGGIAAIWLGWAPVSPTERPHPAQPPALVGKDAFGNRLGGDEGSEVIPDVIEVIDLSQVFEPRPAQRDDVADANLDAALFNNGYALSPRNTVPDMTPLAPEELPYPRVVAFETTPAHYGEETSEPPSAISPRPKTFAEWARTAYLEWLNSVMPLKGNPVPPIE
jgi:hypothetical protein